MSEEKSWEQIKEVVKDWNSETETKETETKETETKETETKETETKETETKEVDDKEDKKESNIDSLVKDHKILNKIPLVNFLLLLFIIFLLLIILGYLPRL